MKVQSMKMCKECEKEFIVKYPWKPNKFCSPVCYFKNIKTKSKKCRYCKKEYSRNGNHHSYCSHKCFTDHASILRVKKGNPSYRNGTRCKGSQRIREGERGLVLIKKKIIKQMVEDRGYVWCQNCFTSSSARWEMHHIVFRSEAPSHKNLHNERNGIFCCIQCHNNFHSKKSNRDSLVKDRKLWELFPEYISC